MVNKDLTEEDAEEKELWRSKLFLGLKVTYCIVERSSIN